MKIGADLRDTIAEMNKFYPNYIVKVHLVKVYKYRQNRYEDHTYYKDLEDKTIWDWNYHTTHAIHMKMDGGMISR